MIVRRTLVIAGALLSSLAQAQEKPPAAPPEMEQFKVFVGTWKCESKNAAMAGTPEHPSKGTFSGKMDLDGFWFIGSYQEEKSKENPVPEHAVEFWGYDPATKLFTSRFMGTMHVTGTGQSKGWEGDTMTWTDEAKFGDKTFQERTTFTKDKTGKTLALKGEVLKGSTWAPVFTATCKK